VTAAKELRFLPFPTGLSLTKHEEELGEGLIHRLRLK
jgi:hypothetical protein